jgi:protein SCO1/2
MNHRFDTLPFFGDSVAVVQADGSSDTLRYQVPPFSLVNQKGEKFGSEDLKDKVYLATFFSTNSPFLAKISKRLLSVNFRYRDEPDIAIVCFTLDPHYDQPAVLDKYANELRVNPDKFIMLTTADSTDMIDLARTSFLIDDPLNSSVFWLVDTEQRLRGKYDGNKEEEMQRAVEDIALLKKEMDLQKAETSK